MLAYKNKEPGLGDIVVFKIGEQNFFYRMAGLPADTIDLVDKL